MITIPIYIFDTSKKDKAQKLFDENESLGFEKNKFDKKDLELKYSLVDFSFDERTFIGYWIDPCKDDETGTNDIILYIAFTSFRTPYNDTLKTYLHNLLKNK